MPLISFFAFARKKQGGLDPGTWQRSQRNRGVLARTPLPLGASCECLLPGSQPGFPWKQRLEPRLRSEAGDGLVGSAGVGKAGAGRSQTKSGCQGVFLAWFPAEELV